MRLPITATALSTALLLASCAATPAPQAAPRTACPAADPRLSGQWAQGPAAFEHADSGRSHVFDTLISPSARDIAPGSPVPVRLDVWADLPGIYNLAIPAPGELYALGGITGRGALAPYVVRLSGEDGRVVWRTPLRPAADSPVTQWTYPGVIGVAANGDVYAVQDAVLYRVARDTGAILGRLDLPTRGEARNTAYNGFTATADGKLVMKSHHRPPDCAVDGFQAFVACGTEGASASVFAVVDPDTMTLLARADAPELIGGRITATRHGGRDLIYAPGVDALHRYVWDGQRLTYDSEWGPQPYRQGDETPATAAGVMGDFVILQTNALPSPAPTRLIALAQDNSGRRFETVPFAGSARSFIPSMPSVDVALGLVFVTDGLAPGLAAIRFDPASGFTPVWRAEQGSLSFSALIGPPEARVLIATDMADGYRQDYTQERLVWRDAATGEELARSAPFGRLGGTVIAPDCNGVVYAPAPRDATLNRLALTLPDKR
jgi:hypothetical protein